MIQGKRVAGKPLSNRRKTAGKPLSNRWKTAGRPLAKLSENRWKTAGKLGKPLENRWETAGKPPENRWETSSAKPLSNRRRPLVKLPGDHWQNGWKNRWKTVSKIAGKRASNRWKTGGPLKTGKTGKTAGGTAGKPSTAEKLLGAAGKPPGPLENRRLRPLAKLSENRPETAGKSPVFGSLLPVSIRDGNGWKGPLRRHFSAFGGGGCHKGGTFQAQPHVLFETMGLAERGFAGF